MKLRKACIDDIDRVIKIHNELFDYKYTYENYLNEVNLDISDFMVLEHNEKVIGYFIVHSIFETMEVVIIAIDSHYQGRKYGKFLMEYIFYLQQKNKCSRILLEVSSQNKNAITFYELNDFKRIDTRKNYYGTGSNAYIYERR